MTHGEQRIYLIKELLAEDERYKGISVPFDEQEQKNLLRSLMNVRMPKPISRDFLQVQDEYLQYERDERGITDGAKLPSIPRDSRLVLWQGDITTLKVDAIVNAARLYGLNPDTALERTCHKFRRRFTYLEEHTIRQGRDLKDMTLAEMDAIWDEAKSKGL